MTQKEPDTMNHKRGSRQREDQIKRVDGKCFKEWTPPSTPQLQRIKTQRGTDRD